jgi:hypothetical protein
LKFKSLFYILLLVHICTYAQHNSAVKVKVDIFAKTLTVEQDLTFYNASKNVLNSIVLNDWNNAFSSKNSALAKQFSDEYIRNFHLANEKDRGSTSINEITDDNYKSLQWNRLENKVDIIEVKLLNPIQPNSSQKIKLAYVVKLANSKFTRYGFDSSNRLNINSWLITPSRYENNEFAIHSNHNIDDIVNALSNYSIEIEVPKKYSIASNLDISSIISNSSDYDTYSLKGKNRFNVSLLIGPNKEATIYKNDFIEVSSSIENTRLEDIHKTLLINKITEFVNEKLGASSVDKILVTQEDYDKQPFYGLSQLPTFLSPFSDQQFFELMFLKTYLNNYLKENLQLNLRTNSWLLDGIQVFVMMQYIDEHYPNLKMTGSLSSFKLLKSYNLINIDFNQQYNYLYMLMARKNLDQALNEPKNRLIKFNQQIANKYRAGLSFKYLDSYLDNELVLKAIQNFMQFNAVSQSNSADFEKIMKNQTDKDIDWFFRTIIETRDLIDFRIGKVKKTETTLSVNIKNKTKVNVPIAIYELKNDTIVYKKWLENISSDSTVVIPRNGADKLTLNYFNEVPEYNLRNNWKSLKGFFYNNRPIKLNFYKDLEEPYYNQLFYVPNFEYNLYDGIAIGMNLNNKSILNKPFTFSVSPTYATNTNSLVGSFSTSYDQNIRDTGRLYTIRYSLSASTSHYAEDAIYTRINPSVTFKFRDKNFRTNKNEFIQLKQLYINREESPVITDENTDNYSVFSAKYGNFQSEATKHFGLFTNLQVANSFGKVSSEISYRKLFENNRQITLRMYAGAFLYKDTSSEFFSFGLDRPTDYLFEYNLLGRSEATGLYSQQYVPEEGGFKSQLETRFANQWITTINASFNIWNWVQIYGDAGLIKNKNISTKFVYDSGLHLNLVPEYFELFLPVYSSNGYALNKPNYGEKIRFVITLSPKTLTSLFTRRWF